MSRIFLLGEYDFEMHEIKKILKANNEIFFNKDLKIDAKLSNYSDKLAELYDYDEVYAIELVNDYKSTKINFINHPEFFSDPSSIEKVCEILNVPITREQKLIGIDDYSQIDGLNRYGANNEEISKIRRMHRKFQGVTEDDELLAEKSIKENYKTYNDDLTIIKSYTDNFLPIYDRVYPFKRLIVYNLKKFNYYGNDSKSIYTEYFYKYKENIVFEKNFFSISNISFSEEEILNNIDNINTYINHIIISYHTFMFPFEFSYGKENNKIDLIQIIGELKNNNWNYENNFDINKISDNIPNYNEYNYFNEQAKHILYERKCSEKDIFKCENFKKNENKESECKYYIKNNCIKKSESFYFTKENVKPLKYKIFTTKKDEVTEEFKPIIYVLDINEISLRIFKHGIAILCFHLENYEYKDINDILNINQFGRRIYPPFLNYDKEEKIVSVKTSELSSKITIEDDSKSFIQTNFESFNDDKNNKLDFIIKNLCNCFVENPSQDKYKIQINPLLDDRMFVVCWYGNDEFSSSLKYNYKRSDKWYEFLFVDKSNGISCQNEEMKEELIKNNTYQRWSKFGTLFGISRYSFICLTNSYPSLKSNSALFLIDHMRTMYYQLIVLTFIQRVSILRFKKRIKNALENNDIDKFEKIQEHYLSFINKICLREVTSQEQGIELYNMMRNIMGVTESAKELKEEIEELSNLANTKKNDEINNKLNIIAVIGGVIGFSTLLVTIMTLNKEGLTNLIYVFICLSIFLGGLLCVWFHNKIKNLKIKRRIKILIIIALIAILIAMTIISVNFNSTSNESTFNYIKNFIKL